MTTFASIEDKFYSLIITGEAIPNLLVAEWRDTAAGEYEEDMGIELIPDSELDAYTNTLSSSHKSLLGRYMQREFITRELSRYGKVTGIDSKDEKVSGLQSTKQTLRAELIIAETAIAELLYKLKKVS